MSSADGRAGNDYLVHPSKQVAGRIRIPGDKSISHRSLMLGGIAQGRTEVGGFLDSADCLATLAALRAMGVEIERKGDHELVIEGAGPAGLRAPANVLDMGNAGTAIRLFMGLLSGQPFESVLTGDASLQRRPMERVASPLRSMGARIDTTQGKPPVRIHPVSRLQAIEYALPMASAQVKSAIMLAALSAEGTTLLTEPAPTRDHTERMLRAFGVQVDSGAGRVSLAGGQRLRGTRIAVPGDFSSAAFFLVAGCLAGAAGFTIENVGINPTRTGLLDILRLMGADLRVHVRPEAGGEPVADLELRASTLRGIRVPPELVPLAIDEFPVLFIAAAAAQGETVVTGAEELRVKESDRLAVMAEGLGTLGIPHELAPDGIRIEGGHRFRGGAIDSHGDHRIAMAFTVAGLVADGEIRVRDVENVGTSFPGFLDTARQAGIDVKPA
jgi:3-phosphoshikimate 1-carboxyvinyltransferase